MEKRAPVAPARAVVGLLVGLAVACGLYWTIGRAGEEVPAWIALPPGAVVTASMSAPPEFAGASVRYYLRLKLPGEASTVLLQFTGGIRDARWAAALPRPATRDDLGLRSGWPAWVRNRMHRVSDVSAGRVMTSRTTAERIHVYAWPDDEQCVVELVQEGPPSRNPIEETPVLE